MKLGMDLLKIKKTFTFCTYVTLYTTVHFHVMREDVTSIAKSLWEH